MSEQSKLISTKVKSKGIFNFKEAYSTLYDWLVDEGYSIEEKTYKEAIGPGGTREIEIEWKATKEVSDYFQFVIKLNWNILGMTDIDVQIDGKKQKMNKGLFEIKIATVLEKDYESRWEGSPFMKFIRTVYDRYLIPSRVEEYEGKLISEADELIAQTKAFLSLQGKR